jgi:uncharacterized protein YabE (DUF348 family)
MNMTKKRLIILAVTLSVLGIFLIALGARKTVAVDINGQISEFETSAWTVSGLLDEVGISISEEDIVDPSLSTWIYGGETIDIETASWMTVNANGDTTSILTLERVPVNILAERNIHLSTDDQILVNGKLSSPEVPLTTGENHSIQVLRAQPIQISINGKDTQLNSSAVTLGDALWEAGIVVNDADRLQPPADTPLEKPLQASLDRAQLVTIQYNGGEVRSRSAAETIGAALQEAGLPLQGLDYSVPPADEQIPEDGVIRVVRVEEELLLESEPIPFDTQTQPVVDLEIDARTIVQPGQFGLNTKRVRVRYENGLEISRQVEAEYISQEPQPEIIGYGTQIVPRTMDTPDGTIKYWRALNMYAISYNVTSNGGYGTATGVPLAKGVAAIDPRYISYGTLMYVPGYGKALAADTGGGIQGRMIDLGYLDEDYVSWHEWVTVYFLWPPPENVVWIIP